MDILGKLTGHSSKEADLYANFDKVEAVSNRLIDIITSKIPASKSNIMYAIQRYNSCKGVGQYVDPFNQNICEELLATIEYQVNEINNSILDKAEKIKTYSEATTGEKIASTATMLFAKAGEGFASVFEGLGDGIVSVVGWVAPKDSGLEQACKNFVEKDLSHDLFKTYYDSEFAQKSYITEDSALAGLAKFGGQIGGFIVVGAGASALGSKIGTGAAAKVFNAVAGTSKRVGVTEAALMAMGGTTQANLQSGKDMDSSAMRGALSAAAAGTFAWGIGSLFEKVEASKLEKKTAAKAAGKIFKNETDDAVRAIADQADDKLAVIGSHLDDGVHRETSALGIFKSYGDDIIENNTDDTVKALVSRTDDGAERIFESKLDDSLTAVGNESKGSLRMIENWDDEAERLFNSPGGPKGEFSLGEGGESYKGTRIGTKQMYKMSDETGDVRYLFQGDINGEAGTGAIKHELQEVNRAMRTGYRSEDAKTFLSNFEKFQSQLDKRLIDDDISSAIANVKDGVSENETIVRIMDVFKGNPELGQQFTETYGGIERVWNPTGLQKQLTMSGLDKEFNVSQIFSDGASLSEQVQRAGKISSAAVQRMDGLAIDQYATGRYLNITADSIQESVATGDFTGLSLLTDGSQHSAKGIFASNIETGNLRDSSYRIMEVVGRNPNPAEQQLGADKVIFHLLDKSDDILVQNGKFTAADSSARIIGRTPELSAEVNANNAVKKLFVPEVSNPEAMLSKTVGTETQATLNTRMANIEQQINALKQLQSQTTNTAEKAAYGKQIGNLTTQRRETLKNLQLSTYGVSTPAELSSKLRTTGIPNCLDNLQNKVINAITLPQGNFYIPDPNYQSKAVSTVERVFQTAKQDPNLANYMETIFSKIVLKENQNVANEIGLINKLLNLWS